MSGLTLTRRTFPSLRAGHLKARVLRTQGTSFPSLRSTSTPELGAARAGTARALGLRSAGAISPSGLWVQTPLLGRAVPACGAALALHPPRSCLR